ISLVIIKLTCNVIIKLTCNAVSRCMGRRMNSNSVFISHASADDGFVKELCQALEGQGLTVWADSRELSGGDKLAPTIKQAIA
ncbi:MAG: toll/interleukin-1 receptor domain-containing protein, partial [Candidatus Binatia bacterium]